MPQLSWVYDIPYMKCHRLNLYIHHHFNAYRIIRWKYCNIEHSSVLDFWCSELFCFWTFSIPHCCPFPMLMLWFPEILHGTQHLFNSVNHIGHFNWEKLCQLQHKTKTTVSCMGPSHMEASSFFARRACYSWEYYFMSFWRFFFLCCLTASGVCKVGHFWLW